MQKTISYACRNRSRFIRELAEFVRFPSISARSEHAEDMHRCASWLARHLQQIGLDNVETMRTKGHPVVYADWLRNHDAPTVLIYGHYDVQPVEPLDQWSSPPFSPTIRGENLYGRGASDDKGQMFAHLKAIEACLKIRNALPVNIKCLFEGEEEIGSLNLIPFLERHRQMFAADVIVLSDTRILAPDRPAITYSLRGALSLELEVRGQKTDLHSGNFGGAVHNPLQSLCELIARLHDANGRVAIPGFYDSVRECSGKEREYMARTAPTDAQILRDAGAKIGWGDKGYSLYERTTIRPALTINGIAGGYQGESVKAVIPSRAVAKFDFRLVPDQEPREIESLLKQFINRIAPTDVEVEIRTRFTANPALVDRSHLAMQAAATAYRNGFGAAPVLLRSGGTIPVVSIFHSLFDTPAVLMGFGLADDQIHAPNEKFHLPNFFKGIATSIYFLAEVGELMNQTRWQKAAVASARRRA